MWALLALAAARIRRRVFLLGAVRRG